MSLPAPPTRDASDKELIATLRRSQLFRSYEQVFSQATGLALALQPREYWQLAHRGKKHENPFCALLAENPKTLVVCLQAHDEMIRHTGTLPHTVTCPFGLTETAVPVKLGHETIGYLRVGQVLRRAPRRSDTEKVSAAVIQRGVPFSKEHRRTWEKNPLIPPEKYDGMIRLLTFFADQLSGLCNQIVLEQQNAEPAMVTKARAYIEKHRREELSLPRVAAAAGASVFHFCKVFHQSTGLTFTDYVARARIEEAHTRLLNPSLRISEVAYDAGFQSLTQFNRTFKRVFAQTPTAFRAGLAAGHRSPKQKRARPAV